jgi:hypothetical protein
MRHRSVFAWKAAGGKNGQKLNPTAPGALKMLAEMGINAPGVFSLPVCSGDEAHINWGRDGDSPKGYLVNPQVQLIS